jgi:uncharacterized protein
MDQTVESCVNQVGVDLNTASASLLKYVSGVNSRLAEQIVRHREEHGPFTSRSRAHAGQRLGEHTFVQAAGFCASQERNDSLYSTAVHPEAYEAANAFLQELGRRCKTSNRDGTLQNRRMQQSKQTVDQLSQRCGQRTETHLDIISCLEKRRIVTPRDGIA